MTVPPLAGLSSALLWGDCGCQAVVLPGFQCSGGPLDVCCSDLLCVCLRSSGAAISARAGRQFLGEVPCPLVALGSQHWSLFRFLRFSIVGSARCPHLKSLSCLCAFQLSGAAQDKVCFKSWSVEKPVCHHILISFLWFSGHPVSPH
ncbi:hypothetical protein AMECASPLE_008583 [Ameca splendens]|uniref:Secreted protein n=1 Tax=Ameca splendens TaxID=208324 RepID=A0ABV0YY65_9TELE